MGTLNMELIGTVSCQNKTTGDTCEIKCCPKSWKQPIRIEGFAYDKNKKKKFEISGSWSNEIYVKNLVTG
jgi:hypothetical protein